MTQHSGFRRGAFRLLAITIFAALVMGPVASASAQDGSSVTVDIEELDGSGISGTAVLTADGDQTIVSLQLEGAEEGYEGHLFDSACDNHDAATVFYALDPVDADLKSETVVDASFSDVTGGGYWVHIHQSAAAGGKGVACGEVPEYSGVGGTLPASGVGPLSQQSLSRWLYATLLAGLIVFAGAIRLRHRGFDIR